MRDLRRSVLDYDAETLAAIAATRGLDLAGDAEALRAAIVRQGSNRLSLALLWEQLSEPERRVLLRLAASGGSMRAVYFESEYGALRTFGPGRLARERLWEQPANLTERLYFLGLIFRGFEKDGQAAIWYLPDDVRAAMPLPAVPADREPPLSPVEGSPAVVRPADDLVALAVFHVLLAARSGNRRPARAAAARLALDAGDIDEVRLAWLGRLAERLAHEAGFLSAGRLTPTARARARLWLSGSRRQAVQAVAAAWAASAGWDELRHAPGLRLEGGRLPDCATARQALVAVIAGLEADRWYSVQGLKEWLRQHRPGFLRPDADFASLYVRDAATGEPLDGIGAWMGVEGRFVDEALFALSGLGAVSLGSTGDARLFSPSSGAFWTYEPSAPVDATGDTPPATIDDGLTVTTSPDAPLLHLYQIESFADPVRRGTYTICRASLQRAEASGVDIDAVIAFLRHHAGASDDAAAGVRRLLASPTVRIQELVALSTDDAEALRLALVDSGTAADMMTLPDGRFVATRETWRQASEHLTARGWQIVPRR